jgi:BolA protein
MQSLLKQKIESEFAPTHFEIFDESASHSLGARTGRTETHFRLIIVSFHFDGLSRVERERNVYQVLTLEMAHIHALSVRCFSPAEWEQHQKGVTLHSPKCKS